MRYWFFITQFFCSIAFCQSDLNDKLIKKAFSNSSYNPESKRKFIKIKGSDTKVKANPLTYLGGGFLFLYQNVISEQIQANCNYKISCSNYAKLSMEKNGPLRGFLLGLHQLSCCFGGLAMTLRCLRLH